MVVVEVVAAGWRAALLRGAGRGAGVGGVEAFLLDCGGAHSEEGRGEEFVVLFLQGGGAIVGAVWV